MKQKTCRDWEINEETKYETTNKEWKTLKESAKKGEELDGIGNE